MIVDANDFEVNILGRSDNLKEIKLKKYGYPDKYIEHGSVEELEKLYHVDKDTIKEEIRFGK